MRCEYATEMAIADMAFRAWGPTLEETFRAAADATMNAMIDDLTALAPQEQQSFELHEESLDLLLLNFLQKLIYYKGAQRLLTRVREVSISRDETGFALRAQVVGGEINPGRHELATDVKGVTLHRLQVVETPDGWEATVILDV
jgi:SHS2 domain-containing protein